VTGETSASHSVQLPAGSAPRWPSQPAVLTPRPVIRPSSARRAAAGAPRPAEGPVRKAEPASQLPNWKGQPVAVTMRELLVRPATNNRARDPPTHSGVAATPAKNRPTLQQKNPWSCLSAASGRGHPDKKRVACLDAKLHRHARLRVPPDAPEPELARLPKSDPLTRTEWQQKQPAHAPRAPWWPLRQKSRWSVASCDRKPAPPEHRRKRQSPLPRRQKAHHRGQHRRVTALVHRWRPVTSVRHRRAEVWGWTRRRLLDYRVSGSVHKEARIARSVAT